MMPSQTHIKICGLSAVASVQAALAAGADYCGFVHFAKSPRHVPLDAIRALVAAASPARCVLVTVEPSLDLIRQVADLGLIDAIQLHGHETPDRVKEISARFGGEIWKAIPVAYAGDLDEARHYARAADRLLYDARTPKGADLPGGMGLSFDWSILDGHRPPLPWGLAGGLDADNVAGALAATRAPLVDVSSGVESAPGVKDMDKIARFCQAVRHYDKH